MPKPPAIDDYQKLLQGISGIYDRALKDMAVAVDSILKKAYWQIGKIIVKNEQKGSLRAKYGDHLIEELSADLTATNRKGFSITNLRNMRLVYEAFPIHQISDELTWSHYVALSSIKDEKERRAFQEKAAAKHWNIQELKEAMKTYSTDIYDRFLADVFYLPWREAGLPRPEGASGPDYAEVAAKGIHLNQELVDEGLAEIWTVPNKEDLAFLN